MSFTGPVPTVPSEESAEEAELAGSGPGSGSRDSTRAISQVGHISMPGRYSPRHSRHHMTHLRHRLSVRPGWCFLPPALLDPGIRVTRVYDEPALGPGSLAAPSRGLVRTRNTIMS